MKLPARNLNNAPGADDGSSFPASSEASQTDVAAAESQRHLFEAMLKKACPRPLVISRLKTSDNTSGYGSCLCGDSSLLSAFTIRASSDTLPVLHMLLLRIHSLEYDISARQLLYFYAACYVNSIRLSLQGNVQANH